MTDPFDQYAAVEPNKRGKDFARINGSCHMARLTDGLRQKACPVCGTVSSLRESAFSHHKRGRIKKASASVKHAH